MADTRHSGWSYTNGQSSNRGNSSAGAPSRPAPPPPRSSGQNLTRPHSGRTSSSSKDQLKMGGKNNSSKDAQPNQRNSNHNKSHVPLLKSNFLLSGKRSAPKTNESNHGSHSEERREARSTRHNNSHNRTGSKFFVSKNPNVKPNPTIIRPSGMSVPSKKKVPPPRPPPPKIKAAQTNPAFPPVSPPSYEEVLQADVDAFLDCLSLPSRPNKDYNMTRSQSVQLHPAAHNKRIDPPVRDRIVGNSSGGHLLDSSPPRTKSKSYSSDLLLIDFSSPMHSGQTVMGKSNSLNSGFSVDKNDPFSSFRAGMAATSSSCFNRNSSAMDDLKDLVFPSVSTRPNQHTEDDPWSKVASGLNSLSNQNELAPPPLPPRPGSSGSPLTVSVDYSSAFPDSESPPEPTCAPPPVPPLPSPQPSRSLPSEDVLDLPPRPRQQLVQQSAPYAKAIYSYTASQSDELDFKEGDTITLLQRISPEWLYGSCNGREGMFPDNFVVIENPLPDEPATSSYVTGTSQSHISYVALYDFLGEGPDELSFQEGDVMECVPIPSELAQRITDGWLYGKLHNVAGLIPESYVQILEKEETEATTESSSLWQVESTSDANNGVYEALYDFDGEAQELTFREGDRIVVIGTVSEDWFLGKLEGRSYEGRLPASFVKKVTSDTLQTSSTNSGGSEYARVIYDFSAENPTELPCRAGDFVEVIKIVDDNWLLVELCGKKGLVPTMFVERP